MADTKSYFEAILGSSTEGLKTRFKYSPHTEAEWAEITTVPYKGELCFTTDNSLYKVGDGERTWLELDYPNFISDSQDLNIGRNNILSATNTLFKSLNQNLDGTLANGYNYGVNQDGIGYFSSVKIAAISQSIEDLDKYELISKDTLLNNDLTFTNIINFNNSTYFAKTPKSTENLIDGSIDNLILTSNDSDGGFFTSRYQVDSLIRDSIKTTFNEDNNKASASMKAIADQMKNNSNSSSTGTTVLKKGILNPTEGLETFSSSKNSYQIDFDSSSSLEDGFFIPYILNSDEASIILNRQGQIGGKTLQIADSAFVDGESILTEKDKRLFYLIAAVNGDSENLYGEVAFKDIVDSTQKNSDYYSSPEQFVKKADYIFNNNYKSSEDRDIKFFNYLKSLPQGSVIYFAAGEYNILTIKSDTLYFPSDLIYRGSGNSTFIKNIILDKAENIKIADMQIENIQISNTCTNLKIQDCYNLSLSIQNADLNNVYLIRNSYVIEGNAITTTGTGSINLIIGESFGTISISLSENFTKKIITQGLENEIDYI